MLHAVIGLIATLAQAVAGPGGTVSGHVVDAVTRSPVASAEVALIPPPERFRELAAHARTLTVRTDERGRFEFANVVPDRYTVQASGEGYVPRMAGAPTVPVQVGAGGVVEGLELVLPRGGSVSGRVVGPDARPVAGAMVFTRRRVVITRRAGAAAPLPSPEVRFVSLVPRVQADSAGKFVLDGLAPGEYYLRVTASGQTPTEVEPGSGRLSMLVPTYYPSTTDPENAAMPVGVAAGTAVAIGDVTMHDTTAVRVSGAVLSDDGQPLEDVSVRLVPADAPAGALPGVSGRMEAQTSANGAFVLDGVVAGSYLLVAVPPLVTNVDTSPIGRGWNSGSFTLGGKPGAERGSVRTRTTNGVSVEFRDERATRVPVTVAGDAVSGLVVTVRRPSRP